MARLDVDEDVPWATVKVLLQEGHDVVTVQQAGRRSLDDSIVLADAIADGVPW